MCKLTSMDKEVIQNFKRQQSGEYVCHYCNKVITDKSQATADHIRPVARGGRTTYKNLVIACLECNQEKGILTADEYFAYLNNKTNKFKKELLGEAEEHAKVVKNRKKINANETSKFVINIDQIIVPKSFKKNSPNVKKYNSKLQYYRQHGKFKDSIVLDEDNRIIDGYINYLIYKINNVKNIQYVSV